MNTTQYVLLTIDVEDWFQVENFKRHISFDSWSHCETRVEENTMKLLDLLDDSRFCNGSGPPRATFFVLGWIAEKMPHLVREISRRGHEIASHGYRHDLCSRCSNGDLKKDLTQSKRILEDIIGAPVHGYRAPSFSISDEVLELVRECGYAYDSSFNSFKLNSRYGRLELTQNGTGVACEVSKNFYEIPISNVGIGKHAIPVGGGGYFRIMPIKLFKQAVRAILKKQNAYVFYIHPWEIDPGQPRLRDISLARQFRHYFNLQNTLPRLTSLMGSLENCEFINCTQYLEKMSAFERERACESADLSGIGIMGQDSFPSPIETDFGYVPVPDRGRDAESNLAD